MRNMKKIYKTPEAAILELFAGPVMTTTSVETSDGPTPDGGRGNDSDATAAEHRNDWDNIWEGM